MSRPSQMWSNVDNLGSDVLSFDSNALIVDFGTPECLNNSHKEVQEITAKQVKALKVETNPLNKGRKIQPNR